MYIAGTQSFLEDVTEWHTIPLGQIESSHIYKRARQYLNIYPETTTVVAHSMGAIVAQHLASEYDLIVRTQGAPIISPPWENHPERVAHYFDPVSLFDLSATHSLPSNWLNPHNY